MDGLELAGGYNCGVFNGNLFSYNVNVGKKNITGAVWVNMV